MIFYAPTSTILRSIRNMQKNSKFKLRSLLTVWAGTLVDPCSLSGFALHGDTFIRTETQHNLQEKKLSCEETISKISLPALLIIGPKFLTHIHPQSF